MAVVAIQRAWADFFETTEPPDDLQVSKVANLLDGLHLFENVLEGVFVAHCDDRGRLRRLPKDCSVLRLSFPHGQVLDPRQYCRINIAEFHGGRGAELHFFGRSGLTRKRRCVSLFCLDG